MGRGVQGLAVRPGLGSRSSSGRRWIDARALCCPQHGEYALQLAVCHRLEYLADALARSELPTTDVERFLEVVRQWRWDRRGGLVLWREALSAGHSGAGASAARG